MARKDAHRPSAINPEDYDFVAAFGKVEGLADAQENQHQREVLRNHMELTGGNYSQHEHGGSCHVCGASMIYAAVFYHNPSNSYIRTGFDCAEKMEISDTDRNLFRAIRTEAQALNQAKAGKLKAQGLLRERGLLEAVEAIFEPRSLMVVNNALYIKLDDIIESNQPNFYRTMADQAQTKLTTAADLVRKLVKYGDLSDKQWEFLASLLEKAPWNNVEAQIAEMEAKRQAEREAGSPAPAGRNVVTGVVVSVKIKDSNFGIAIKMLVQSEDGYKVWTTVPRQLLEREDGIHEHYQAALDRVQLKGKRVQFTATLTPSDDDHTFAFASRPSKAKIMEDAK